MGRDYIPEGKEREGGVLHARFDFIPESGEVPHMPEEPARARRPPDPGFPSSKQPDFVPDAEPPPRKGRGPVDAPEEALQASDTAPVEETRPVEETAPVEAANSPPAKRIGRPKKEPPPAEEEPPPPPPGYAYAGKDPVTGEWLLKSVSGKKGGEVFRLSEIEAPLDTDIPLPKGV